MPDMDMYLFFVFVYLFVLFVVSELGSLTTANLMEKVKGLQNLAYQLGLEECKSHLPSQYIRQLVS